MKYAADLRVTEANPIKQGLKLRFAIAKNFLNKVTEANPIKQGLKPAYGWTGSEWVRSQRLIQ